MLSEKSQWTENGTMFVDLDWLLNASSLLSASAELLVLHSGGHLPIEVEFKRRQRDRDG